MSTLLAAASPTAAVAAPLSPRMPWSTYLVLVTALLLVLGPLLVRQIPQEIARWHLASAWNAYLAHNADDLHSALQRAREWNADSWPLHAVGLEWLIDRGHVKAANDWADVALERFPNLADAWMLSSSARQKAGRHSEAVDCARQAVTLTQQSGGERRANMLNNLAYVRAVGKIDLAAAASEIDEAIALDRPLHAYVDTRGYIRYLRGEYTGAREDFDKALAEAEAAVQEGLAFLDLQEKQGASVAELDEKRRQYKHSLAVMYYHRALTLDKLAQPQAAERDRARVRELGFEPSDQLY